MIRTLAAALSTTACIAALATPATAQRQEFRIPSGSLKSALDAYARQTGRQVIYRADEVRSVRSPGARGAISADAALNALLAGTGFSVKADSSGALAIIKSGNDRKADDEGAPRGEADAPNAAGEDRNDDILVTAQRVEQKLRDVPISISVLGGKQLDRSGDSVIDQIGRVPGVAESDTRVGGKQLTVRGVSSANDWFAGTSTVGYYLDSVPFGFVRQGFVPDSNAYDLERVEILRGPQGTLYGVSALNGVVRVLTAEPDLDTFALKMRALGSSTRTGGEGYRGDGAINVPLVSGKLAVRSAVSYESRSGWIDGPTGKDINDGDNLTARVKLKAAPTDDLSVTAMLWHTESDAGAGPSSARDRTTIRQVPENSSTNYDIYALRAELDLGEFSITSSTSYMDFSSSSLISFFPGSADHLTSLFTSNNFSQEIALTSNRQGRLKWSVGGIYRNVKDLVAQNTSIPSPNPRGLAYRDYSKSYAVFGELSYDVMDNITLSGGLRYFKDNNEARQLENPIDPNAVLINNSDEFNRISPRVVATWHPTPFVALYASFGEGFRSGFSQSPTILSAEPNFPGVKPDYLTNYEIGAKGDLLNGLLSFEGAFFFMDWQGVQQNVLVNVPQAGGALNALINGESASGLGAELTLTARPVSGMTLGTTYSWNSLQFDADIFTIANGQPHLLAPKGSRLFNSPKYTASAFVDYHFPIGDNLEGNVSGSINYAAIRLSRAVVAGVTRVNTSDPIWMARAAIGVSSENQGWSLSFFVDNLTDFKGAVSPTAPGQDIADTKFRARPRTVGIQVGFKM